MNDPLKDPGTGGPVPVIGGGTGWMVVEKPSGLSVHNDPGRDLCALLTRYVCGDERRKAAVAFDDRFESHHGFTRLGLHAAALEIRPPETTSPRRFEAMVLPEEIRALITRDDRGQGVEGLRDRGH